VQLTHTHQRLKPPPGVVTQPLRPPIKREDLVSKFFKRNNVLLCPPYIAEHGVGGGEFEAGLYKSNAGDP
jgi:hypothetical protein